MAVLPTAQQADQVLERIAQGVCVVDQDGRLAWANAALREYPQEVRDALARSCHGLLADLAADTSEPVAQRVRRISLRVGREYVFDLTVSALPDADGRVGRVVGILNDTTAICDIRERIDAINAAGRELIELYGDASAGLDVAERLRLLEDKVIRYCRDLLQFTHFEVRVLDPATNKLELVLAGGFSEHSKLLEVYARTEGGGISGFVAATGESYICPDVTKDPRYLRGLESARSSLTVPLRLNDRVVGTFNVEADKIAAFSEEDRQVAEVFGRYVAVALHMLKLLAVERSETTGQVAADVQAELAQPLNDIIAEATHVIEQAAAGGDAPQRARTIIQRVDRVQRLLQAAAAVPGIRGLVPETTTIDPVLQDKRVLVAEDEDIIRETIAEVLSKVGALPVMAKDGRDAIAMVRAQHFDLVLSDIKMPYKNGYDVFAAAKQANPQCQVILITGFGYDPEHSIVRASREGLAAVLFKPFKVEQLVEAAHKAIAVGAG
jgi:CheY-like chemotaxis protein